MTDVLLVDDHASSREPLAMLLRLQSDIGDVIEAGSLAEARQTLVTAAPAIDVAIVDLDLPDGNGVALIHDLRQVNQEGQVLVLTASLDRRAHARAVEAGASGVVHKSARSADILDAVRRLHAGEPLLSPAETIELLRLAGRMRDQDFAADRAFARLTPREREMLHGLAEGLGDAEIATRLSISNKTVRNHMVSLLDKLGVDSRLQALVLAVRQGIVEIE